MSGVMNQQEELRVPEVQTHLRSVSDASVVGVMLAPVDDDDNHIHRPAKIQRIDECELSSKISIEGSKGSDDTSDWGSIVESDDDDESIVSEGNASSVSNDDIGDEELSDEDFSDEECSDDEGDEELCREMLPKIKANDPSLTSLVIRCFPSQGIVATESVGQSVGESTHLKKLALKGEIMEWEEGVGEDREKVLQFSSGFACNRSVEHFMMRECSLGDVAGLSTIRALSPCFEHNTCLQSIVMNGCDIGDGGSLQLASILSRRVNKSSLRRVSLDANRIGDEAASFLVESLRAYDNLRELSLGDNEIASKSCMALGKILSDPDTKLEKLNLENNQISDSGIILLRLQLAKNKSLRELSLSMNSEISQVGWNLLSMCLRNGKSSMEKLDVSSNNITNEGAIALGGALTDNTNLKILNLFDLNSRGTPLISAPAWKSFFNCLRAPTIALSQIDLRYGSIDEGGLDALASALSANTSVKMLDLSHNAQIPITAWKSFFTTLKKSTFSLKELYLQGNTITDNEISYVANALSNNETLETLLVQPLIHITNSGWEPFRRLLCDKSSIMDIYTSNHTLCDLGQLAVQSDLQSSGAHVQSLLLMNKSGSKNEVARKKIIQCHFENGESHIQDLLDLNPKIMAQAISWMGRDDMGGKLLYQVFRSLPSLLVCENRIDTTTGVKRKWVH